MRTGSTRSEILGEIMLALKSMKGNYSRELRSEINECFEFALHHRKTLGLDNEVKTPLLQLFSSPPSSLV